jgi:hypothetical protein
MCARPEPLPPSSGDRPPPTSPYSPVLVRTPPPTPEEAAAFARSHARRYRTMLALLGVSAVLMWFATVGRPARRHGEPVRSLAYVGTLLALAAGPLFVWRCPRCRRRLGRRLDVARCPHCDLALGGRRAAP